MPEVTLKNGWTRVAFGDVVKLSGERSSDPEEDGFERYVGLDHIDPDELKIRRWGDIADGTTFTSVFRPGHVLFGKRRAYQRKVAVADFSGVCSGDIYVFEPKSPHLLTELLPFICQTGAFFEHAIDTSAGSLSPRTNWNSLASYEFALPPLPEQRRLASILAAIDRSAESLTRLVSQLMRVRVALLDAVFDFRPVGAAASAASRHGSSEWIHLGTVAHLQPGFAFRSADFAPAGDRLLRGSNVGVDCIDWDPTYTRYWPSDRRGESASFVLRDSDLVIAMDRPFVSEGFKVARIMAVDLPALLLQRVGRFVIEREELRSTIWAFMHSRSFQSQLLAQQEGTDLPHISKNQIEGTLVPARAVRDRLVGSRFDQIERAHGQAMDRRKRLLEVRRALTTSFLA